MQAARESITKIAKELGFKDYQVSNVVTLIFDEDCTIPFIARYRKEMTGSLDEVGIKDIRDRYQYLTELNDLKAKYLKVIITRADNDEDVKNKLSSIKAKIETCETKQELEDIYLPFKPKRRTRGQIAKEKGLAPLSKQLESHCGEISDLASFVKPILENSEKLKDISIDDALSGAADILAEQISENAEIRAIVREASFATGFLASTKNEAYKPEEGKKNRHLNHYENYFNYRESVNDAMAHRIMAVRRGEAEGLLKVNIEVDQDLILDKIYAYYLKDKTPTPAMVDWFKNCMQDAYKRLIAPSIETEVRLHLRRKGESEAINVFSKNLKNLLMLPPLPDSTVLGVDPGLRTGSKLAVVSRTGKVLGHDTIYPNYRNENDPKNAQAKSIILKLCRENDVNFIAVGNGTGSKEIDTFIKDALKENGIETIKRAVVNESGASVYSTDPIARDEFPDLDATIRSAISIARRLQDPLAELVKIDPRSIGVGQYQHDVNVNHLSNSLKEVVESCVNSVGVNVNTASFKLLSYVSGIGQSLAKNIVKTRETVGAFKSRDDLLSVSGFGPKVFQQAAGFLRIVDSDNPLDNSAVHPERYALVEDIVKDLQANVSDVVRNKDMVEKVSWEKYISESVGMPTLQDIREELIKPGRDPREDGNRLFFSDNVNDISDLKMGMKLKGTVTNVTNFGAFVDIGVHQDGLVHISELTDEFIKDPSEVVSVGTVLDVKVINVDTDKKRISLSCKMDAPVQSNVSEKGRKTPTLNRQDRNSNKPRGQRDFKSNRGGRKQQQPQQSFTMDDLLAKFGKGK